MDREDSRKIVGDDTSDHASGESTGEHEVNIADVVQNLAARMADEAARAAALEVRLELTERNESALRESLERERERDEAHEEARRLREKQETESMHREEGEKTERIRREQAEEKVSHLEAELEALIEAQGLSDMETEGVLGGEEAHSPYTRGTGELRTPWWRRFLGLQ